MTDSQTEQLCSDIRRYVYRMLPYSKLEHKVKHGVITITLSMLFVGSLRSASLTIHVIHLPSVFSDEFPHARTWATKLVQQVFDFGAKTVDLNREMEKEFAKGKPLTEGKERRQTRDPPVGPRPSVRPKGEGRG